MNFASTIHHVSGKNWEFSRSRVKDQGHWDS